MLTQLKIVRERGDLGGIKAAPYSHLVRYKLKISQLLLECVLQHINKAEMLLHFHQ